MRKTMLLVACAALCAILSSCSQTEGGGTATLNIESKQLLEQARAAVPAPPDGSSGYEITVKIAVVIDGEVRKSETIFTSDSNSDQRVYTFGDITAGATVEVYCLCYYSAGVASINRPWDDLIGASEKIVVGVGANSIKVKMVSAGATDSYMVNSGKNKKVYELLAPNMLPSL